MEYRLFGRTGLRVSRLFLGAMTFGTHWGGFGAGRDECRKIFDAYADAGGNVIDTASNYTGGESEEIVGELVAADRDRFVLATKYTLSSDGTDPNSSGNHRKNLTRSLERSLRRLRTDHVDVLWVHIWDPHTPIEETMRALDDAVRAGKVLYVGMSDVPAWVVARANTLAEWRDWSPFVGLQVLYNLVTRDIERELLPMADAFGMSVAVWSPLAGGLLSGKFTGPNGPPTEGSRVDASAVADRDMAIARTVHEVADGLGISAARVALAWTMHRSPAIHPIIGARRLDQVTDNLGAAGLELPADALARLDEASTVPLGFPMDFVRSTAGFVHGEVGAKVTGPGQRYLA